VSSRKRLQEEFRPRLDSQMGPSISQKIAAFALLQRKIKI